MTGAAPELSPTKSACVGDAVLRTMSPTTTRTGWREGRCPIIRKRPLHSQAAEKMSPHISIGPEPVLSAHAPSPPAANSHSPAREDSAPIAEQNSNRRSCGCCCTPRLRVRQHIIRRRIRQNRLIGKCWRLCELVVGCQRTQCMLGSAVGIG